MFQGAGGLGAVSLGISEWLLVYLVIAIPMLVINLAIRGVAHRRGAAAARKRRLHLILTVAFGAVVILTASDFLWERAYQRGQETILTVMGVLNLSWLAFFLIQTAFLLWALWIAAAAARQHLARSR